MALDPSMPASVLAGKLSDRDNFAADFADAYNTYAMTGLVLGALNTGGEKALLEAAIKQTNSTVGNGSDTLAKGFAGYWATVCIVGGVPSHGGIAVVSSVNNAMTLEAAFKAAVMKGLDSSKDGQPYYETLITDVETVVKTIAWTVVEMIPAVPSPIPVPFPEVIA